MIVEIDGRDCRHDGCPQAWQARKVRSSFSRSRSRPMKTIRLSRFSLLPGTLMIAFDDHVHALNHIAVIIPLKCDDSLEPENIRPVDLGDLFDPGEKPFGVDRTCAKRDRFDGQIMNFRGSAA
jgi:hypothetical protein